jgi:hypothetical protein
MLEQDVAITYVSGLRNGAWIPDLIQFIAIGALFVRPVMETVDFPD